MALVGHHARESDGVGAWRASRSTSERARERATPEDELMATNVPSMEGGAIASRTARARGGDGAGKVPLGIKIGYSFGIYGIGLVHTSFSVLLMFCYTDVFGIAPADAGLIILCGSAM